jgi:ATP-dependent RNA helicase RhlE
MTNIERAGYTEPTQIQAKAIPKALEGADLLGIAQTGTGKTAAFVLPILHNLLSSQRGVTRALIVAPTRELAEQTHDVIRMLGAGTGIRCAAIYGGVGPTPQIKALREGVDILVACPGRLLDHLGQGYANLKNVNMLVLDEADRMFDMGFLPDVKRIISYLPESKQTMLFSATFPKEIEKLAQTVLHKPARVEIGMRAPVHTVSHALFPVSQHLKTSMLLALLKDASAESVLIFTRTKHKADNLAQKIKNIGIKATRFHSNRTQSQRQAALDGFKSGRYTVMVATDIAARGLDVENITHVINFDMPDSADSYIHRIGRTGRAEKQGDAYTLVTPADESEIRLLEKVMGKKLERKTLPDFDYNAKAPEKSVSSEPMKRGFGRFEQRPERDSYHAKKRQMHKKQEAVSRYA